jgi:hypothetical protein
MKKIILSISAFFLLLVLFIGCKVNYSFTGASISPEIKTVSIEYFDNKSTLAPPTLSQSFTETLKDLFISQTSLTLINKYGDLQFKGYISNYQTAPVAIQGNETAALNKLTITVFVEFTNQYDETQNFAQQFSRFANYESTRNLTDVENALIEEINKQLVQDIFNKSVSNW